MNTEIYPLVSIVTPAYNQAEYLVETIESVLAQDYPNIQYIVLDDGSTDHTREILKRYDGKLCWESHSNMGQAKTLNKGWSMSTGEILAYLSSDDCLAKNAVSEAVHALKNNPQIVLTYSDYYLINNKSEIIREFNAPDYMRSALIENLICHPGPGAFFRRRIFDELGGWQSNLRQIPDFEYWLRASELGEFMRLKKPLAYSRIHESSQSFMKTSFERAEEPVNVVQRFWAKNAAALHSFNQNLSLANSYLLTARMHLISGRIKTGVMRLIQSIRFAPELLVSARFWKTSLVALLRRAYYLRLLKK